MSSLTNDYWLYVDDPTDWTRVHKGACRFCSQGAGVKGSRLPDNRWHGPLALADAVAKARRIGKRDTAGCDRCLSDLRIS